MRLALFGGTFDPIHKGHVDAALAAAEAHRLDRVLVMPSGAPPHKPEGRRAPYPHRLRMVELACQEDSRLVPSRLEEPGPKPVPHYSIDTIERVLSTTAFEPPLRFIIGADAFAEVGTWKDADRVISLVEFLVAGRPRCDPDAPPPASPCSAHFVDCSHPASSSTLRHRVKIAGTLADLAPPAVCAYIWEHGLYRP